MLIVVGITPMGTTVTTVEADVEMMSSGIRIVSSCGHNTNGYNSDDSRSRC